MADEIDYEVEENEPDQVEDQVEAAIPDTEIAVSASDIPVDFGVAGVMDFPDAAFGETDVDDEKPGEGEPDEEDDEDDDEDDPLAEEDVEDVEVDEPIMPPGDDERAWE